MVCIILFIVYAYIVVYAMDISIFNAESKMSEKSSPSGTSGPYLDQISNGYHGNFKYVEAHKKLLIQPVQIPNLDHCRVSSDFVNVAKKHAQPFVAPDGTVTKALRQTIQNSLPAIRKAYIQHLNEETAYNRKQYMEQLSLISNNTASDEVFAGEKEFGESGVYVEESSQSLKGYIPGGEEESEENILHRKVGKGLTMTKKKAGVQVKIGEASFRQNRRRKVKKKKKNDNPKGYVL